MNKSNLKQDPTPNPVTAIEGIDTTDLDNVDLEAYLAEIETGAARSTELTNEKVDELFATPANPRNIIEKARSEFRKAS